jgi:hypothetical protein
MPRRSSVRSAQAWGVDEAELRAADALLVKERMSEFDGLGETEYLDLTNPQLH